MGNEEEELVIISVRDWGNCAIELPCGHPNTVNYSKERVLVCPVCGLKIESDIELGLHCGEVIITYPNGEVKMGLIME